ADISPRASEFSNDQTKGLVTIRAVTGCLLSLLILSTFLGNTLVCAAVIKFRHLRSKVTNFFVVSLAISDLLVAALVMPWKAITEVAGYWPFGDFCEVWVAFDIMCSTASILNLCVISMDRYWAIASPFRYERKMTQRVAFMMIGLAWWLSILISFIPVQLSWHRSDVLLSEPNTSLGAVDQGGCHFRLNRTYAISSSLISFYIPVAIMIITYTRIFPVGHALIRQETKLLKTLSVIMGVFVCCWLPFFVLNCIIPFCSAQLHRQGGLPCVSETTFDIFVWFGWTNSSLNPIIYAFNADFRKAFSSILGCSKLCHNHNVETVNFSNELASQHHHHNTTFQNDPTSLGWSTTLSQGEVTPPPPWSKKKVFRHEQDGEGRGEAEG
uniref:G-protein coupled receptors family 1 profile domain-containing protein n=1 Tax=Callorhinchus milii TaxID=7868 RepID=A0A4W3JLB3_CALMI